MKFPVGLPQGLPDLLGVIACEIGHVAGAQVAPGSEVPDACLISGHACPLDIHLGPLFDTEVEDPDLSFLLMCFSKLRYFFGIFVHDCFGRASADVPIGVGTDNV